MKQLRTFVLILFSQVYASELDDSANIIFFNDTKSKLIINDKPIAVGDFRNVKLKYFEAFIVREPLEGEYPGSFIHCGSYTPLPPMRWRIILLSKLVSHNRDKIVFTRNCRFLRSDE